LVVLSAILLALAVPAADAASAQADVKWRVDPLASTTAAPGTTTEYRVQITNVGDSDADGGVVPLSFSAALPAGLTISSVTEVLETGWSCSVVPGEQSFNCSVAGAILPPRGKSTLAVRIAVAAGAQQGDVLTTEFTASGGDPTDPTTTVADPTTVSATPLPFGIDAFDLAASADPAGVSSTRAAAHPYGVTTSIDFHTETNPVPLKGIAWPVEPVRDILVDLPPGLLGNVATLPRCTLGQLANSADVQTFSLCPPAAQLGVTSIHTVVGNVNTPQGIQTNLGPVPVFNMVPPPGVPARFAFVAAGTIVNLDARLRSATDYGVSVDVRNVSEGLAFAGTSVTFWGAPADPSHRPERACPGEIPPYAVGPPTCPAEGSAAVLRQPTSCTAAGKGLSTTLRTDSWVAPGDFDESTTVTHQPPGFPSPRDEWGPPLDIEGCAAVPFNPGLTAQPTTETADSPSGLDLHLTVPQPCWDQPAAICQADLRDAEVKLPQGMTLNPSAAAGLAACAPAQVGLTTPVGSAPIHFDEAPVSCPDSSKIGDVTITTPLLKDPLKGAIYLAAQSDNPFSSLLAMYLVAEGSGVVVKQAGRIEAGPGGRLTTVFTDAPQQPFSDLHVSLYGGPRAALRTPPNCGTYAVTATLTPWSGNDPVDVGSGFEIDRCPNSGFDPKLSAGTQNPLAGSYSPFNLRLSREDGTQELGGLSASLPEGLVGKPAGIPYCPESVLKSVSGALGAGAAWIANPGCPAASQVGTVTVGAGAGPNPFFTTQGRAYLAGPYKGAPLSLAVVAPAVAGPFDLGSVLVRNAVRVDPATAQITAISDPFPTILYGIPLDLRDVRVDLNRNRFTLNPTSCDPMAIEAKIASATGQSVDRSNRFQVAGCDKLGFKPELSLRLNGATKRTGHPALRATLTMPPGGANIAKASVALPRSEFLDQGHIRTICTRVQFAAGGGGGEGCPAASVYGHARAITPLLDQPLEGPVYLRSSNHNLPDLVASLDGQIHIDVAGRIDTFHKGIRTTFETVPDAPVAKFTLTMQGGRKGLIVNSRNLCASTNRATAKFDAQNGKVRDFEPLLKAKCGAKGHSAR
jgi:uncharacterized repeat protein (TIGR01451 family)